MNEILAKLIKLSRDLASPTYNLAILGEGNTSADGEDGTFWVKASGSQLSTIMETEFSQVNLHHVLKLMDNPELNDVEIAQEMKMVLVNPEMRKPSIETFLHALCIHEAAAKWVGHTHPISVMSILCSKQGAEPFLRHIYPDEIVGCGEMPAVVPYADPGLPLACAARDELRRYLDKYGTAPKLILMVNHGMVALGQSPKDVLTVSLTADKWARTLIGTFSMGGPQYLSNQQVKRIETRPDEAYRRTQLTTIS